MQPRQFLTLQSLLSLFIFLAVAAALILTLLRPDQIEQQQIFSIKRQLPRHAFLMKDENYALGDALMLALKASPPTIRIPDLRSHITFTSKNGRPDSSPETMHMHFMLNGSKEAFSCLPGEQIHLRYEKKPTGNRYVLEKDPDESLLWITAEPDGNDVQIHVSMIDQDGNPIPGDGRECFAMTIKEGTRATAPWELGSWRVDGTLLARQKARWTGQDKFFERYGGDEFQPLIGKQRIDFGEGEDAYALFASVGTSFAWNEGRWVPTEPGPSTQDKPLMVIKKVEERVMMMELWDVEGKNRIALNLIRMPETFAAKPLTDEFRFVGARTKTKVLFELNHERMILKPNDWIVLTDGGWKKLSTPDEIDAYVERKIVGPLFVFEGFSKKEDRTILVGTLVTPSRTEVQSIEIAMHSAPIEPTPKTPQLIEPTTGEEPVASHY